MRLLGCALVCLFICTGCPQPKKDPVPANKPPVLGAVTISEVKTTSAKATCPITNVGQGADGNGVIKGYGICYGLKESPTIADTKLAVGTTAAATLDIVANLTNLTANTIYYVRGYVEHADGIVYSDQAKFTTDNLKGPDVTTNDAADLTSTTFTIIGKLTSLGTSDVTQYGHVLSATSQTPTTADTKTEMGASNAAPKDFKSTFSGLKAGTTYYVRAYATNATGTGYSEVKTVKTASEQAPAITTQGVDNITVNSARATGTISSGGTQPVTQYGHFWSSTNNDPKDNDSKTEFGATGTPKDFASNLTGLQPGTTYYVRAYARSAAGTTYGDVKTFKTADVPLPVVTKPSNPSGIIGVTSYNPYFTVSYSGSLPITEVGVCYSTSNQTPTVGDSKAKSGSVGAGGYTDVRMNGLTPNTTYYVRAYAITSAGVGYSEVNTVKTLAVVDPKISLNPDYPTFNTYKSITTGSGLQTKSYYTFSTQGVITLGTYAVKEYGTCSSFTNATPTINDPRTILTDLNKLSQSKNSFVDEVTINYAALNPNTAGMYVRVYVTTEQGTFYSDVQKYNYTNK
jgi:hypothetical protein